MQVAIIGVRGRDKPEVYRIFKTRHGPLVATESEWEEPPVFSAADGHRAFTPLALRWEAIAHGESAGAFLGSTAPPWDDFLDAVRRFGAPSQNFVYADTAGNIGYAMSGALPVRAQGDGSVPVPGWTGAHEWIGHVPAERLPARLNPPSGEFVTANGEIDRGVARRMTRDWAAPFRTRRIVDLLGTRTGLDAVRVPRAPGRHARRGRRDDHAGRRPGREESGGSTRGRRRPGGAAAAADVGRPSSTDARS